ncbi:hypothetical protein [Streptomyces litchfieldiae]|uniref:Uncharacterized protein n=1 Tax=Streptomyces litchfieldiae TaxID=3075543 RepID=A0ABU2MSW4_9ACTN|nr:hypothetical protein [Streptomyces sp. DSM 44938]MDT0344726.1 hypothetical protein [Streptomyces sp. DSM 44938]
MAMPEERNPITYCSLSTLRARGWTPFLVRAFLGEPDRERPEELYLTSRVREAERRPDFVAARDLRRRRAHALREANERRREQALTAIRTVPLEVPVLAPAELADRAVRHRNVRDAQRAALSWGHRPRPVSAESAAPAELARWEVEYLRDTLAPHGLLLEALPPGRGRAEGRRLLTERIFGVIAAAYPALELECRRQQAAEVAGRSRPGAV